MKEFTETAAAAAAYYYLDIGSYTEIVSAASAGAHKYVADSENGTVTVYGASTDTYYILGTWTPIGTKSSNCYFKGVFDGGIYGGNKKLTGSHKVSEIYINDAYAEFQGLFGYSGRNCRAEVAVIVKRLLQKSNLI